MAKIIVRSALPEELAQVNRIRLAVNELHAQGRPDFFRPDAWPAIERQAALFLERENADVLVALCDDRVAGFAMVQCVDRPENPYMKARRFYHVEEFGVDAAFRRRGVATALTDFMKQQARAMGCGRIELDMWEFNRSALAFYESAGFATYRRYMELPLD